MVNKCKDYIQAYSKKGLITEEAFWMSWGKGANAPLTEEDELFIDACVFITPDVGRILTECKYKFDSTNPTFTTSRERAIYSALERHHSLRLHSNQMFKLEVDVTCYVKGCERQRIATLFRRNDTYVRKLHQAANMCGYPGDTDKIIDNIAPQENDNWTLDYLIEVVNQMMGEKSTPASVVSLLPSSDAWNFFVNEALGEPRCTLEDYTKLRAFAYGWYLNGELVAVCPVWEPRAVPQHVIDTCCIDESKEITVQEALEKFTAYLRPRYAGELAIYCDLRDTVFQLAALGCGFTAFAGYSDNIAKYLYTGDIPWILK